MEVYFNGLQTFVNNYLSNRTSIKILEAGCGSATYLKFIPETHFIGIDISEKQLERNKILDEKIVGDVQKQAFHPSSFDVIIAWNLLEHIPKPSLALEKFSNALKKDGIIILSLPNPLSLKGLLTKYLPHGIHIFVHKYIYKNSNAGKDDYPPYKTFMSFDITPKSIKKFASKHSLNVLYYEDYDILDILRETSGNIVYHLYGLLKKVANILSIGTLGKSEFYIILQK